MGTIYERGQPGLVTRVQDRLRELPDDAGIVAGLARLREPTSAGRPMNAVSIAAMLDAVPQEHLGIFLRVVGNPGFMPHPSQLKAGQRAVLQNPDVLQLIDRYGPDVWSALRGSESRNVLVDLARQVAAHPEQGQSLVRSVLAEATPTRRRRTLGQAPPPRRQRASAAVKANENDPFWRSYQDKATKYAQGHPEWLAAATGPRDGRPGPSEADVRHNLAVIYQTLERAQGGNYARFSHERKLALLDDFIRVTAEAGLRGRYQGIANNCSGKLSEHLFTPPGAIRQPRLVHPGGTNRNPSIPDYELVGPDRVIIDGRRNFVEQKSDNITGMRDSAIVNPEALAAAAKYADDELKDRPGITGNNGVLLIDFVRPAGNGATRVAMLRILFANWRGIEAVRFGDGPWITRTQWLAELAASQLSAVPQPARVRRRTPLAHRD